MDASDRRADAQIVLWNGPVADGWVQAQPLLDALFAPFSERLVEVVRTSSMRSAIDIGCGTGATTLALAEALGSGGALHGDVPGEVSARA